MAKKNSLDDLTKAIQETKQNLAPTIPKDAIHIGNYLKSKNIEIANGLEGSHNIPQASELLRLQGNTWQVSDDNIDYNNTLAANQPFSEQFKNMVLGFGKQAVAGFTDAIASWDIKGIYDMALGNTEEKYGNWLNESMLSKWGKDVSNLPIYQSGDSMADFAYWAKLGQSLGYTGGIISEMVGEQIALAALTGGVGNLSGLSSKTRLLKTIGQGLFGTWKGVQEGYQNGLETQSAVYQKYKELGYDEDIAQKKANEAATLGFRAEVGPLATLNALQFMTTFGVAKSAFNRGSGSNLGFSGGVETLIDRALPSITNKYGKSAIGFGINALSEGVEEGIQTGVSKYAQHETLKSTGNTLGDLDIWDKEMRDSIVGGVFGGVLFAGAGKLLNKYTQGTAAKQYSKAHDNFLFDAVSRTSDTFKNQQKIQQEYNKANKNYSENKSKANLSKLEAVSQMVKESQYNSHLTNTVNALQLDYINEKTTAFETHIEQMQTLLDAVNNGDIDTLKKYNIFGQDNKEKFEGAVDIIKNTFEQNIKDSYLIKEKLENNLLNVTSDFESAFDITKKEYLNTKKLEDVSKYANALNILYAKDTQFNQLSSEGKRRFQLELELESFNKLDKLSDLDLQRKEEIQSELKDLEKYKVNDIRIVDSINKIPYVSAYVSMSSINQSIEDTNTELSKLRDIDNIKEKVKERTKKKVEKAKSKEEIQEVVQQAQEQGTSTPELETIAKNKQSELAAEETIKKINPEFKPNTKQNIEENSVEADINDIKGIESLSSMLSSGTLVSTGSEVQAFSPREFRLKDITDEHKEKLKNIYNNTATRLDAKLNKEANFEDFIKSQIEQFGYDKVDEIFEGLKYAWNNIGRDISNAKQIYDTIYNSDELGMNILNSYATTEEIIKDNNKTVENTIIDNSKTSQFDKDNKPLDKDGNYTRDGRTSIPKTKAAFLGMQYADIKNEDGSITKIPVSPQLNQSEQINNNCVLDPDYIKVGTILKVSIPKDVDSIKVANWVFNNDKNKWEKSDITFGEWRKREKAEPGSQKYNNKVPMVAIVDGNIAFFLHDTQWYNTTNVTGINLEAQKENIKNGIKEIQTTRAAILAGKDTIKIEERKFGSIFELSHLKENNQPITLSEATGETKLALAVSYTELADSTSKTNGTINSKINLVNNLDKNIFEIGQIYEIRKVNTNEHIALRVLTNNVREGEEINDIAYNNIKFALISSIIINAKGNQTVLSQLENKYGVTLSKAQDIHKSIKETVGLDIQFEIGDYMNMFVQVEQMNRNMISKLEDNSIDEKTGKIRYPLNTNYISVDNNVVKIILKDGSIIRKNEQGYDNLPGINLNNITEKSLPHILNILDKNFNEDNGAFKKTHFDISKEQLGQNKPFLKISSTGSIIPYNNKHGENTYEGYIKDNVKTNVKSFAIKTVQGDTKWITDIQPMIYYGINTNEEIKPIQSAQEKAQEAAMIAIDEIDKIENESIQRAINELPEELKIQMKNFKIEGLNEDIDFNFSQRELTHKMKEDLNKIQTNNLEFLTPDQQKKLVNSLFNLILTDIGTYRGTINLFDVIKKIDNSIETYLQPEIDKLIAMRDNIVGLNNPHMDPLINNFNIQIERLEKIVKEKNKIISNGVSSPKGDLYKKFERFLEEELTETEDIVENENGEVEFNYSKSFLEKDVKTTFSDNLKIFFSNIKKQNPKNREDIKNFAYLNDFKDIDDVIQALTEVMVGLPSSIDDLISILETKKDDPTYAQILNKIKNAPEHIQNEILYKMIQSKLDMHMVLYSYNRENETYSLVVKNISNSYINNLENQWIANFEVSGIFNIKKDEYVYNEKVLKSLLEEINDLKKLDKISKKNTEEFKKLFNKLGLIINNNTIEKLLEQKGNNIFLKGHLVGVFEENLKNILSNINKDEYRKYNRYSKESNPYKNAKGVLEELKNLDTDLNGTRVSKSFRVEGKSYQGSIQKMMVYDIEEQLKDTNTLLFQSLLEIPYSKNNYILNLLKNNDKFKQFFDISFISPLALKQDKQKAYDDRNIDKLSKTDSMLSQYGLFQNTLRELGKVLPNTNLEFRMGQMFNPSLSDKGQMLLYSTALLDLTYKNFDIFQNGKISLNREVIEFLTKQIYDAEFDRIVSAYKNKTNIKNYDEAAKRFLSIPELNNINSKEGANIHTVISQSFHDEQTVEALKEQFREEAMKVMEETMNFELLKKVDIENNQGTWFDAGFVKKEEDITLSFFDTKYLESKKGNNINLPNSQLAQIAALDFIVNQYLSQNNTYQLIVGDMALYTPSIKKYTKNGVVDNVGFSKAVGESIAKRVAMLIAPGNKLANSKDDKYLQIFVNDPIKMTSTAREYIKQYYGSISENNEKLLKKLEDKEKEIQNVFNNVKDLTILEEILEGKEDKKGLYKERAIILKTLSETNQEIGGYFDIEGTDAQEYTTWKEHIDILFRQGRLTEEEKSTLQSAYNKLEKGEELDNEELSIVMNPIKPVYAGNNIFRDKEGSPIINRIVYIKSSSFPLLPQLTKDFKLDKIRQQMENLQSYSGKNVRLSYQTANKIGAVATNLTTNDLYNVPFKELYAEGKGKLGQSVLELDRNNFKIQQDTPYKTDKFLKKNSEDMTTMGSQMWKIILGSDINKINSKIFPNLFGQDLIDNINRKLQSDGDQIIPENKMVSGRDLDKIKFHVEKMYFDIQKEMLYDELGLNSETRKPLDTNKTIELLHALLKKETTTRQYPDSIIDNLELTYTKDELEFMLPIWLSNGSNKFESLLQSIITNRLIKINLPGNQHISTSSEGFEKITSLEEMNNKIKSQIVWVDPTHSGELKATIVDGKVKESEILVQSKFRKTYKDENGKLKTELIDLTKEPYSKFENGVLVLNTNMIDSELLTNFSFRIPTSSHQSGAILKVVGFLPEASGDMLVVPKEHTKQIGEDYDIDKRTLYKLNYEVQKDGKLTKLNYTENNKHLENLLYVMFEGEYQPHLSTEESKSKSASLKARIKMLENCMIDVYKSVYTSPNNNIQKKINKILSFDNATNTVKLINDKINSTENNKYFSVYSDDYQRQQMKLGADGKMGIGGHSNAVTFQAQMERLKDKIVIQSPIILKDGKISGYKPSIITIGDYTSNGVLGEIETLDGERSIGDVHTENQNSATDNIKAQIMGKRNENSYTMNVLIQLTFRGFDMAKFTPRNSNQPKSVQLSSLFISQPILRRYVELKEQNKSITSKFDANSEQIILSKLIEEFNTDYHKIEFDKYGGIDKTNFLESNLFEKASMKMTGDRLYDNLLNEKDNKTWDSDIQLAVLQKFFQLSEEAKYLNDYQSLINLSTSGLGISYFNVLERIEVLNKLGDENMFTNIKNLVGVFIPDHLFEFESPKDKNEYTKIGRWYVKPTTTEGTVLIHSLSTAEDIMDNMFPYKQSYIKNTINKIVENKGKELGKKQKIDLQYKIIDSMRDYLYAVESLGFFSGNIDSERFRLFFDKDDNKSLAKYLKDMKDSNKYPLMYSNELLKSLVFDGIQNDGSPSIIKHQTYSNTNFDKTDKYNSFLELLRDDKTDIGVFNGEQMTPRKLAQDLATYAYLANNENGAIGFRDFINIKYLTLVGISENIRNINKSRIDKNINSILNNFTKQFYQHNPEEAKILSDSNTSIKNFVTVNIEASKEIDKLKKEDNKHEFLKSLTEFTLKDNKYNFVAIRDTSIKLSDKKYKLFQWNGSKYIQIPVLGTFGFNEYNPSNINQKSLIYPEVGQDVIYSEEKNEKDTTDLNQILDISDGVKSLLEQIYKSDNVKYKEFAEQLLPYIDPTTKVVIEAIEIGGGEILKTGVYKKSENTIYISPNILKNLNEPTNKIFNVLEEVILEEIIHSITISQLDKFGKSDANGNYIPNTDAPVFITKLSKLHDIAKQKLPEEYYTKNIYEFIAGAFVSNEFKEKLDKTMVNGKSLFDIFKDAIAAMVRFIKGTSYSDETVKTVYDLIKYPQNTQVITEDANNVIEDMKKKDTSVEAEINNIVGNERPGIVKQNINNKTSIKGMETYSKEVSNQILQDFDAGKEFIITPNKLRSKNSAEYKYMNDLIAHLSSSLEQGEVLMDKINITNVNDNTQYISKSKDALTLDIGNYSSKEFRLPEIHKCK